MRFAGSSGWSILNDPLAFEALNRDYRYQLTVLDEADSTEFVQAKVVRKIADGRFTIRTSAPRVEVSWQVTGIRQDAWANAHRIPVEADKSAAERGYYIHPELFGAGPERSIGEALHPGSMRRMHVDTAAQTPPPAELSPQRQ